MKTNKWFKVLPAIAFAAILAFSSCAKEDGGNPDTEPAPEGYGYLAINPTADVKELTRAYTGVNVGTDEENFVDKIYVLLYNTDVAATLQYRLEFDVDNENGTGSLDDFTGDIASDQTGVVDPTLGVITEGRAVKSQAYKMIVVLNPSAAITAATVAGTNDLDDFDEAKAETVAGLIGTDRFVMTNADGIINVAAADLQNTKAAAEAAPVSVNVDRAVAKITVEKGADFDTNITKNTTPATMLYESIDNISWYLDVTNPETFWVRHAANDMDGASETATTAREKRYATDPNFTAASQAGAGFNKLDLTSGNNLTDAQNALNASSSALSVYSVENTMETAAQATWKDNATQVVVKCQIVPIGFSTGDDYYSMGTAVFTHTQALIWAQAADPTTIPSDIVTNAHFTGGSASDNATAFQAALVASGFFIDTTNGNAPIPSAPTTFSISGNGITFHLKGWNVYRVPVKHFNEGTQTEASYGHYGVVRNNAYTVTITNITGPGNATSEKYIAADITINPWLLRTQEESLGNE